MKKPFLRLGLVFGMLAVLVSSVFAYAAPANEGQSNSNTATPITHLVVIFQENVSFDHYFGTYPNALNLANEPRFEAAKDTPTVNGLNDALLTHNPNSANPKRLSPAQALTCDQDHRYDDEQKAFDHGLMDKFVETVSGGSCPDKSIVMDYYDGNTVTGLWNYAQYFAMNDNSFGTTFGPSTPGALNLISGQTHGATPANLTNNVANGSVIADPDPAYDDCSGSTTVAMSGTNVGDLLDQKSITWGWFQGGFKPTATTNGKAVCGASHKNIGGNTVTDYSPHHSPFQYYLSTSNPHHLPPTSADMIGKSDQAHHQYDLSDFWTAANAGNLPAVSFLKAASYQDGHAGYSDPLDEQHFLVDTINQLEKLPSWKDTAVVIAYDDSDGWYDHVMGPIINFSQSSYDFLSDPGMCGTAQSGAYLDRCGYGPRLPLLVVSPYARHNFVDNTLTDQSSILRFIEDNWKLGRIGNQSFDQWAGTMLNMFNFSQQGNYTLFLDPITGQPMKKGGENDKAQLRIAHLAPTAGNVDVYLNNKLALSNVSFGTVSDYMSLDPGNYAVDVYKANAKPSNADPVISESVDVYQGGYYTYTVLNFSEQVNSYLYEDDMKVAPADGKAKIKVLHASPDAEGVDIAVKNGPVLVKNLNNGESSEYLTVAAGNYDLEVRAAGTNKVLYTIPTQNFQSGRFYTVIAEGLTQGSPAFKVQVVTDL